MKYNDKTRQNLISRLLTEGSTSASHSNPSGLIRYLSPQTQCCNHSQIEPNRRQVIDININININTNINFQGRNQQQNFENLHSNYQEFDKYYENQHVSLNRQSMCQQMATRKSIRLAKPQNAQSQPLQQNRTQHKSPNPIFTTSSIPVQPSQTAINIHHLHAKSPPMRQFNTNSNFSVKKIPKQGKQTSMSGIETPVEVTIALPPLYETPRKINFESNNNISAPSFIPLPAELSTQTPHTFTTQRFDTHCYSDVQEFKFSRDGNSPIKMIDGQEHIEQQLIHLFSAPPVSPENPQKPLCDGESYGSLKIRTGVENAINLLDFENSSIESIPSSERQNFSRTLYGPILRKLESQHRQYPSVITEQSNFSSEMSSPKSSSKGGNMQSSKTSVAHHIQDSYPQNHQPLQSSSFSRTKIQNHLSPQSKLRMAVSPGRPDIMTMVSPPKEQAKVRLPLNMLARWDPSNAF